MNQQIGTQFVAPFTADNLAVGVLLAQYRMTIPDMQRPYAWKAEQAEDLVRDLERLMHAQQVAEGRHQHYFGSLVVLSKPGRDEIVDGQQRMTTVSTLLGVIQQALADLERAIEGAGGPQAKVNAQNCLGLRMQVRPKLWREGPIVAGVPNKEIAVLEVSPEVREMYEALIDVGTQIPHVALNTPAAHLKQVADVFRSRLIDAPYGGIIDNLGKLQHLQRLHNAVSSGLVVVRLGTQAAGAAYELFESLNSRGLDLNALDLVKVWMLAVLSNANINSVEVAVTMRELASGDVDKQIKFFEDFYYAMTQRKPRDGQKEYKVLASEARRFLFKDPDFPGAVARRDSLEDRILTETRRMKITSEIWHDLKGYDAPGSRAPRFFVGYEHHDWMKFRLDLMLGSTLRHKGAAYPLLMVAADRLRDRPNDFLQLVHLLERFFFRFRIVCGGSENQIADVYMKLIGQLEANGGIDFSTVQSELAVKIEQFADDGKFDEQLPIRLRYEPAKQPRLRYFFNMIELYSYNPSPKMQVASLGDWWIEHVQPQNPKVGDPLPDELLHSIGNLCLLDPKVNKILKNFDFQAKKQKVAELARRPIPDKIEVDDASARRIFSGRETEWGPDQIEARQQDLRNAAHVIFAVNLPLIVRF